MIFSSGFHALSHGADIGVSAAPDVLKVENQNIDSPQHLARRLSSGAVKRVGHHTGLAIFAGLNVTARLLRPVQAMFGSIQRNQVTVLPQQDAGSNSFPIYARLIGDQANTFAFENSEVALLEDIDPEINGGFSIDAEQTNNNGHQAGHASVQMPDH